MQAFRVRHCRAVGPTQGLLGHARADTAGFPRFFSCAVRRHNLSGVLWHAWFGAMLEWRGRDLVQTFEGVVQTLFGFEASAPKRGSMFGGLWGSPPPPLVYLT